MIALTNDEQCLFSTDNSGLITIWRKPNFAPPERIKSYSRTYLQSILADSHYLFGGSTWTDCSIKVYDKRNFELIQTLEGPLGTIFVLDSDDDLLFSGSGDSRVSIWNKRDWSIVGSFSGQRHFVLSLAVDKEYIYAGGIDDCTNVFSRDDYSQVASLQGHDANILALAYDDQHVYSGSGELWWGGPGSPRPPEFESSVRVWDKNDWTCVAVLHGHTDNVNSIAIDKRNVYSVSDDSTLRIFSKKEWNEILCLEVDARRIDAMTTDASTVYLGCSDGSVRLFQKSDLDG